MSLSQCFTGSASIWRTVHVPASADHLLQLLKTGNFFCSSSVGSGTFRSHLPQCMGTLAYGPPYDHSSQTKIPRSMLTGGRAAAQVFKPSWLTISKRSTYSWPAVFIFSIPEWRFTHAFGVSTAGNSQHIRNHPSWVFHTTSHCKATHQS